MLYMTEGHWCHYISLKEAIVPWKQVAKASFQGEKIKVCLGRHLSVTLKNNEGLDISLKIQAFKPSLFLIFHYSLKSYLPFVITLPDSFHLAHYPAPGPYFHYANPLQQGRESRFRGNPPALEVTESHLRPWPTWSSAGDSSASGGSLEKATFRSPQYPWAYANRNKERDWGKAEAPNPWGFS